MSSPLIWSLLAATVATSTPSPTPSPAAGLSIDDAVGRVLATHPAADASHHASASARATTSAAASAWLPRIDAEAWYRMSGPVPELVLDTGLTPPGQADPLTIRRELGTPHNGGTTLTIGWRALDFGARDARTAAARAALRAANAQGHERAAELAFATRAAYLASLFFAELQQTTHAALDVARASLEDARARQRAGIHSALPAAAQQSRIAELSARLADAVAREAEARTTLSLLLGHAPDARPALSDTLQALGADAPAAEAESALAAGAHPTLQRLEAARDAARAAETAAERAALPTLDLFARAGLQYPATFVETDRAGLVYAVGVSLKWRVFDGGALSGQADANAARADELGALADATRRDVTRAVSHARTAAAAARAQADASAQRVAAAQTYVDVASRALTAGLGTALDLQNAEALLDQARLAAVKARFDGAMAHAMWLRALGLTARAPTSSGVSP